MLREPLRNALRTALILLVVGVWVLAAPLASATGACAAMSGLCEGPCGAASCSVTAPSIAVLTVVDRLLDELSDRFPSASIRLPELPPRSLLPSA